MGFNIKNPINLREVCNQTNNIEEDIYINMTEFGPADYREIMNHTKPITLGVGKNAENVTIMDLFNLPLQRDEDIIAFIKKHMHIDITSKEGIKEIGDLMKLAAQIYEDRYFRALPIKIKNRNFNTTNGIISFLRETKTNKRSGILNCAMAKICYAVDDIISNERIRRADFLDNQFINQYLDRPFQIEDGYADESGNLYRTGKVVINNKVINFKLISRQKSQKSIIGKQIADPKYYSLEEFKDLVGATIYVDTTEEAVLMMQYIDQIVYRGEGKISNKNVIDHNFVILKEINGEFKKKLVSAITAEDKSLSESEEEFKERSKKGTSEKYREIKLVGSVPLAYEAGMKSAKYSVGTEIKFVVGGHDNESGLSLQSIYDYIKRFRELTRLGLPIRKLDIVKYVNDFFENIDEILVKKNKKKEDYYNELYNDLLELGHIDGEEKLNSNKDKNDKLLALGLYKYFRNKLIKLKFKDSKQTYYFDERALKLRDIGMHKASLQEI